MGKEEILLFVYGTLRLGGSHHHLLGEAEVEKKAFTLKGYSMYSAGWYPVVVPDDEGENTVTGDILRIRTDLVPKLDVYEGNEFTRKQIEIPGIKTLVWIYLFKESGDPTSFEMVPGGDWLNREKV